MKVRYIRDWANGNTNGTNSNWKEIKAFDINGKNVALNKNVTSPFGSENINRITDGDKNQQTGNDFFIPRQSNGENVYVQVDLGDIYEIKEIKIFRFFPVGNSTTQYNATKTEVSENGTTWITVFDSATDGKYYETESGKSIKLEISDVLEQNASLEDVMNELEKISNTNFSTFDIIVVPSLPDTVKEGQVVVISSISCNNIILDYKEPTTMQEGDVFLQYYNRDTELLRSKGNIDVNLNIFKAKQCVNKSLNYVNTYIGKNGVWVGMNETVLFEKGIHNSILGNLNTSLGAYKARVSIEGGNIKIMYYTSSNGSGIAYDNKIDVTPYSKLKVTTSFTGTDSADYSEVSIGLYDSVSWGYSVPKPIAALKGKTQNTMQEFSIDISNINGEYYIGAYIYFGLKTILISKISLEY